jgi:hypothetical protein
MVVVVHDRVPSPREIIYRPTGVEHERDQQ